MKIDFVLKRLFEMGKLKIYTPSQASYWNSWSKYIELCFGEDYEVLWYGSIKKVLLFLIDVFLVIGSNSDIALALSKHSVCTVKHDIWHWINCITFNLTVLGLRNCTVPEPIFFGHIYMKAFPHCIQGILRLNAVLFSRFLISPSYTFSIILTNTSYFL